MSLLLLLTYSIPAASSGAQLQDMENLVLATLQQQGVNFSGTPNWGSVQNPQFSQANIDFCLNEGYRHFMADASDFSLYLQTATITTTVNTYAYNIPPANYPSIIKLMRLFYTPTGLNYKLDFVPGERLLSWAQFQGYTGDGYLTQQSFSSQPAVAAVSQDRTQLFLYPGSANAGDTITLLYAPMPTPGAVGVPMLLQETDQPVVPADCRQAIVEYALYLLQLRAREFVSAQQSKQNYEAELSRIKGVYAQRSEADLGSMTSDSMAPLFQTAGWGYRLF